MPNPAPLIFHSIMLSGQGPPLYPLRKQFWANLSWLDSQSVTLLASKPLVRSEDGLGSRATYEDLFCWLQHSDLQYFFAESPRSEVFSFWCVSRRLLRDLP